jgi:hypothetical protein
MMAGRQLWFACSKSVGTLGVRVAGPVCARCLVWVGVHTSTRLLVCAV